MFEPLKTTPSNQLKKNRYFYALYDGFYLLLSMAVIGLIAGFHWRPLFGAPSLFWLALVVPVLYGLIWSHLVVHTCTHGSLPRSVNRLVGELLGVLIIVRFASWDIVHMRHHKYSDERGRDPHPNFRSFWRTAFNTVVQVEQQLFQQYFDVWGDTPATRRYERRRAVVSYATNLALLAAWTMVLGPWFMVLVFAPLNALAALFVLHFNWSTHNGERAVGDEDFEPTNLEGGYYAVGNRLFAGIYMHKNHHRRPHLFNPSRLVVEKFAAADSHLVPIAPRVAPPA